MTTRSLPDSVLAAMEEVRAESAQHAFWRALDDLGGVKTVAHAKTHEPVSWHRREFVKLMAASLALAGTPGCSRPPLEHIVPYREGPPENIDGEPMFFASAISRDG